MNVIGIVHRWHEKFIKQLDGSRFAGENCTMASAAMGGYRQTLGARILSVAGLRRLSGDTVGGTNLDQAKFALGRAGIVGMYGPFRGISMVSFYHNLKGWRGSLVQGSSAATKGTRYQASTTFSGNHCWYAFRGVNWFKSGSVWLPEYVDVMDPLADGRRRGIAKSPLRVPRATFEKFCAGLSLGDYRLGRGKVYALFTKVTIPHRHKKYGGYAVTPVNKRLKPGYNIRSKPSTAASTVLRKSRRDEALGVYQKKTDGPSLGGSRVWYGDHSGTRWVHVSAIA